MQLCASMLLFQVGEQTVYTGSNFPGVHLDKTAWTEIPSTWQGRQEDQNFKVIFSYVVSSKPTWVT